MEPNKILDADILDILFEGKNKAYGAYQLRKTYNSRIVKAMIAVGLLLVVVVGGTVLANIINERASKEELTVIDNQMAEVKKDEPPPPPPPPPPPTPPPPPEIKQIQFTPPKIVKDEEVKKDEVIKELEPDAVISTKTVESDNTKQIVQAPVEDNSNAVEVPTKAVEEDKIFTKVEIEAEYPGGTGAWRKFLERNLNGGVATDNSAPAGTYTVVVRFIVAKDGSVSEITPETSVGYGMEQEAVRAIKKAPKWMPAQQNGNIVKAYRRQPITFVVSEE
jgi:protein TonB